MPRDGALVLSDGRYNVAPGTNRKGIAIMEQTPLPISLDAARELPWEPGRSAEVFVDGEIEVRFTLQPKDGRRTPTTATNSTLWLRDATSIAVTAK